MKISTSTFTRMSIHLNHIIGVNMNSGRPNINFGKPAMNSGKPAINRI